MRIGFDVAVIMLLASSAGAAPLAPLRDAMAHGRFVAYQPTSLRVINGVASQADPQSIRADLQVLRPRFDALITYDSIHGAQAIPAIARSLGFRAVIVGVWNPFNPAELTAALAAARDPVVVGVSLGNEMLFFQRHTAAELARLLDDVHAPVPLSITEPFHMFARPELQPVLQRLDFLLVNVHPVFQPWFHTAPQDTAVQFVINVTRELNFHGPVLVKETGLPSAPADKGFSLAKQAWFYTELERRLPVTGERAWAYFAAFDAPWRASEAPEEAHWGLYDEQRQPKPVVATIKPLAHEPPRPP